MIIPNSNLCNSTLGFYTSPSALNMCNVRIVFFTSTEESELLNILILVMSGISIEKSVHYWSYFELFTLSVDEFICFYSKQLEVIRMSGTSIWIQLTSSRTVNHCMSIRSNVLIISINSTSPNKSCITVSVIRFGIKTIGVKDLLVIDIANNRS